MDEQAALALDNLVAKLRERSRDRMLDHTIPIHVVHGDGNPIVNGCGVLLQIADVPLLLSCAHVLKVANEKNARLLIPSTDHTPLVVLTGVDFGWTEDERIDFDGRIDDHIDGVTVALTFEMNAVGDVTGERARPPSFKGMSGCGIWRLAAMDGPPPIEWTPEEHVKLVGIEHGVLPQAIKGSLVAELVGLIKQEFPALAPCIELHGG